MTLEITALILALATIAAVVVWTLVTGSPPTPTSPRVRQVMLAALPPELGTGVIYELGAGWGGLSLGLARRFPGHRVVGIERSPLPWLVARLRAIGRANVAMRLGDFRRADLGDAAAVVCYLSAEALVDLRAKLEAELPPGTPVLSNTFAVPGWQAQATHRAEDIYNSPVYLYVVGATDATA